MNTITVKLFYGGKFEFEPDMCYYGGSKKVYENYDPDYITVPNMISYVKDLGYKKYLDLWYKFEDDDMTQLAIFDDDKDVLKILRRLISSKSRVLQVFVDHGIEDQPKIVAPVQSTSLDEERRRKGKEIMNEEVDMTGCEFPDSDDEQPDLFCGKEGNQDEMNTLIEVQARAPSAPKAPRMNVVSALEEGEGVIGGKWDGECHSDYCDSSDSISMDGSDVEISTHPRTKSFNESTDFKGPINLEVGMKFSSFKIFREALKQYAIENGIDFIYLRNESSRITVRCQNKCGWRIHASKTTDESAFQIKTFYGKEHNCGWVRENKRVTSAWLAKNYIDNVRDQPNWNVEAFKNQVSRDYNVGVSRFQTYRAKKMAQEQIDGSHDKQFGKLRDYCEAVMEFIPGSTMKVKVEQSQFQRLYCCLGACKKGFLGACRPVICVDGCFLKGNFGGQLLSAIGKDGNENMYPIAYAVVESECKDSWSWFLELLFEDIGHPHEKGWVIMSDMQKGLQYVLESMGCHHRFCVRHLYANFKLKYKGKILKDTLWNACRATTKHDFNRNMELLKNLDVDAYDWLNKFPPQLWSKHAFITYAKCDIVQNNIAETFNSYILEARDKPIITLCEIIRRMLMKRFSEKKNGMQEYQGPICPRVQTKLERAKEQAKMYICYVTGDGRFEVESPWQRREVVDLNKKTCTCNVWDLTGIPCGHGVAAIYRMREIPEQFVDPFYSTQSFMMAYSTTFEPVLSEDFWPAIDSSPILPPHYKKLPGRPKKARKRAADEPRNPFKLNRKGSATKCGNCGSFGHNARGCKGPLNPNPKIYKKKKNNQTTPKGLPLMRIHIWQFTSLNLFYFF